MSTMRIRFPKLFAVIIGIAASMIVLAGCGSSSTTSETADSTSSDADSTTADDADSSDDADSTDDADTSDDADASDGASTAADDVVAAAKAVTVENEKVIDSFDGITSSPPAAVGKSVAIISCSQASGCGGNAAAQLEAAEALGWEATIFDAAGDVSKYSELIINAVNAGFDGISTITIPPALAQPGLEYAAENNIPVVHGGDIPTDDPLVFGNAAIPAEQQAIALANWIIADSDGQAGVFVVRDDEFAILKVRQDTIQAELAKCEGCTMLGEVNAVIADLVNATAVDQLITTALAQHGDDLNYIVAPFGTLDGLISPTLRTKGREDVQIISYDSNPEEQELCRDGIVGATAVTMLEWTGWAALDSLNRAFNDEEPLDYILPSYLTTKANDCSISSSFDYQGMYKEFWGVN